MFQTMPSTPVPALVMPIVSGCMKHGLHSLERNRFTLNRDFVPDSLFGRIFCGKPVSTPDQVRGRLFPENALTLLRHLSLPRRGRVAGEAGRVGETCIPVFHPT